MFKTQAQVMAENKTMTPAELAAYAAELYGATFDTLLLPTAEEVERFSDYVKADAMKMLKAFHGLTGAEALNVRLSVEDHEDCCS